MRLSRFLGPVIFTLASSLPAPEPESNDVSSNLTAGASLYCGEVWTEEDNSKKPKIVEPIYKNWDGNKFVGSVFKAPIRYVDIKEPSCGSCGFSETPNFQFKYWLGHQKNAAYHIPPVKSYVCF